MQTNTTLLSLLNFILKIQIAQNKKVIFMLSKIQICRLILFIFFIVSQNISTAQTKVWNLKECIDEAIAKNLNIGNAMLTAENSSINVKQAQIGRLPNLNAQLGHNFQFGRSIDPSTNQFLQQNIQSNNVGLSSSVVLFNGFQQNNIIRQNRLNYEAGKYDVEKVKNDVMLQVTSNYLQIILNQEILENAIIQQSNTATQSTRTERLVAAGSIPELNLFQIKSQLANDKLAVARAENQVTLSKVALMQTMNMPVSATFEIQKTEIPEPEITATTLSSTEDIYTTAIQNQPQIKSAEGRVNSAMMGVRVAKGAYLPRLMLSANISSFYSNANKMMTVNGVRIQNVGYVTNDPSQLVSSAVPNYSFNHYPFLQQMKDKIGEQVMISLNVPIFNGRQVLSNVERNKVNSKIAQNNQQDIKNQLRQSIEQASADLRAAINNYNASKEALSFSDAAYNNSDKRFNAGLMNTTDLLIQKNNLFSAKINASQAKYDYFFKLKLLEFYQGKAISF